MTYSPIDQQGKVLEYYSAQISNIKRDSGLTQAGKNAAMSDIKDKLQGQLTHWEKEVAAEKKRLRDELEAMKPNPVTDRDYGIETVTALNYIAKTIISRLSANASDGATFRIVMDHILDNGDEMVGQAFIDSFHEIKKAVRQIEGASIYLREYHRKAESLISTPENEAYNEASKETMAATLSLDTKLTVAQRNFKEEINSLGAASLEHQTATSPKGPWG